MAKIRPVIQTQGVTVALSSGNSGKTDNQYGRPITTTQCDQTIVKLTSSVTYA